MTGFKVHMFSNTKHKKTLITADLSSLNSKEWLLGKPGTPAQKDPKLVGKTRLHVPFWLILGLIVWVLIATCSTF